MKGLLSIPNLHQLKGAYEKLYSKQVDEERVALWSQWARLDPRLAEIITAHLSIYWENLNPLKMNQELILQPWPQALGVVIEQIMEFGTLKNHDLFKNWASCVMSGLEPEQFQQFFIGQRAIGGRAMIQDSFLTITPYRVWGFLGHDIFFSKYRPNGETTLLPAKTRKAALRELRKIKKRFTVTDYMAFLGNHIARRQAQLDLKTEKSISKHGKTKARSYM